MTLYVLYNSAWNNTIVCLDCDKNRRYKNINHNNHSTEAISTESVSPLPVAPPTTISWLLGRTAA